MPGNELLEFIEAEFAAGQTREGLVTLLMTGGWNRTEVEDAIRTYERVHTPMSVGELRATTPQPPTTPPPTTPFHFPPAMQKGPPIVSKDVAAPNAEEQQESSKEPATVPQSTKNEAPSSMTIAQSWNRRAPGIPTNLPKTPVIEVAKVEAQPNAMAASHLGLLSLRRTSSPKPAANASAPVQTPLDTPVSVPTPMRVAPPGGSLRRTGPRTRTILLILIGVVALVSLFGLGSYLLLTRSAPPEDKTFATMYASIPGIQSFRYAGETQLKFSGEVVDALKSGYAVGYTGTADIAFKYDGKADLTKGIDGVHQFGVTAELRSGDYAVTVDSSIELRRIMNTYYLKITNPPQLRDIDLSRLKTYWIAISPADIVSYFGGDPYVDEGEYGTFGGASSTPTLRGMFATHQPLRSIERIGTEVLNGTETAHYRFQADPENMLRIIQFVVGELSGKQWLLNEEEHANVIALLEGITGDIWIDTATFLPRKVLFNQPLKGIVSGIRVDGILDVEQSYNEYNGKVTVQAPRPVMTYPEFAEDVRRQAARARATGDERRIIDMEDIAGALEVYRANHDDRYPLLLELLVTDGLLREIPKDPDGGTYLYGAYTTRGKVDGKSVCTDTSATCIFYHLGASLIDPKHEKLGEDADLLGGKITGTDTKGCTKESGKACYDLVPKE